MPTSPPPIRVLIVQKHNRAIARAALCRLIESDSRFQVVGETANGEDVVRLVRETIPDIIVLDAALCDDSELELLSAIVELPERPRVLLLTETSDVSAQSRAAGRGALGLVRQEQSPEVLFKAIERVHAGEIWLERTLAASALQEKVRPRSMNPNDPQTCIATLSEREREVISLVCRGLKNRAIADRLFVSEPTVRHRLTTVFEKLRITDRLELVIFAYQHGLAELGS